MTNFEKIKEMSLEDMAFAVGCPDDFDDDFEVPEGCQVFNPSNTMPISCIACIKKYLESEAKE